MLCKFKCECLKTCCAISETDSINFEATVNFQGFYQIVKGVWPMPTPLIILQPYLTSVLISDANIFQNAEENLKNYTFGTSKMCEFGLFPKKSLLNWNIWPTIVSDYVIC